MSRIRPGLSKVLAALLWVTTLVVGLLDIYVFQFITLSVYARFFVGNAAQISTSDVGVANTLRITTVLIVGLLYLVFLIVTSEYHFKHFDQPSSWRLMGQTIAVELLIIVIAYFMGPVTW
jgi:predicted LPLAT superfamily acyltransferase